MAISLYLLNKKGFTVLQAIVKEAPELIDTVISTRDKGNQKDYYEEIKSLCKKRSLSFRNKNDQFENVSKYSFAVGWRWLIADIKNLIVVHDSFLPKYRGFSPLVNMLINGEKYIAATALFANESMDAGNIITQKRKYINYPMKIGKAIDEISHLYHDIVLEIINKIKNNDKVNAIEQNNEEATYSIWRDENDYYINWANDASIIKRFIDAVGFPYNGAKTKTEDGLEIITILEAEVVKVKSEIFAPGKLLMFKDKKPVILCGKNALILKEFYNQDGNSPIFKKFRTRFI